MKKHDMFENIKTFRLPSLKWEYVMGVGWGEQSTSLLFFAKLLIIFLFSSFFSFSNL
jgi:hypothetical protein